MDLASATPAQIDTRLAEIYSAEALASLKANRALETVARIEGVQGTYQADFEWNSPAKLAAAKTEVTDADAAIEAGRVEARPLEARYAAQRWTRYYLVANATGHVHTSTNCSSCFPTTEYAWLTEQSGMTAEALVEMAGEQACTVCFPWAPVDCTRKSTLEAPARKAARIERETAKAERDAKAAAKAIVTRAGNPLTIPGYGNYRETVKTAIAANRQMLDAASSLAGYSDTHPTAADWRETVALCADALAARNETTVEAVIAEVNKKVAAKARREGWTVKATV